MSYQIVIDSACDLSIEQVSKLNLIRLPLTVNFPDGKNLPDGFDQISAEEFYEGMRKGTVSTTSQVNTNDFYEAFKKILEAGDDVFYLAFSSNLSGTFQGSILAKNMILDGDPSLGDRITLIDSSAASLGYGLLILEACRKRDEGMTAEALKDHLKGLLMHVQHWFTVDDLVYLKRGGRVSAMQATMGTLLNIKPVLRVDDDGKLVSHGKAKGRKKSLQYLFDQFRENYDPALGKDFLISHGDCLEDALTLKEMIMSEYDMNEPVIEPVGMVIGSHTGPGLIALFFLGKTREASN